MAAQRAPRSWGKVGAAFLLWGLSADRRLAGPQPGGSRIASTSTVPRELVLFWLTCPARRFGVLTLEHPSPLTLLVLQPLRPGTSVLPTLGIVLSVGSQLDSSYAEGERLCPWNFPITERVESVLYFSL